jgi:CDP-glucose 4,6-dehydratase
MSPGFWSGRRVLVTGHTGFKGGWLCLWLQSLGARVAGYALAAPTEPNLHAVARVGEGMQAAIADVRDLEALRSEVGRFRPEVVFHLAAQSIVRLSYEQPVETYATNVMGTVHLLEAVRACEATRAVVVVTSDKCYANREWEWGYRESEALGGADPYSSSKGCAELVTAAYRASYFATAAAVATARAGNVIGGGDWTQDRLVPDIIRGIAAGVPVAIRNPSAVRPWQHVLEPVRGYLMLAERLFEDGAAFAEAWNFGPDDIDCRPVQWIAERIGRAWGPEARWQHDGRPHVHEATYLKVDSSKAGARLGWRPRWNLETALDAVVRWHRAQRAGEDMKAVSLAQIREYMQSESKGAAA